MHVWAALNQLQAWLSGAAEYLLFPANTFIHVTFPYCTAAPLFRIDTQLEIDMHILFKFCIKRRKKNPINSLYLQ